MFQRRYLGLDLSLKPGFAVIALTEDGEPLILEASHIVTNAKKSHGYRLNQIGEELKRLVDLYGPFEEVIREKGFSRFHKATQALYKTQGVSEYILSRQGYEVKDIAPTSVKKHVTGDGKADKSEVERCVRKILRIDRADYFKSDDESDAAGVILAHLISKGVVKV